MFTLIARLLSSSLPSLGPGSTTSTLPLLLVWLRRPSSPPPSAQPILHEELDGTSETRKQMGHTWLVGLGVFLQICHEIIKLFLPLIPPLQTSLLEFGIVLLEELLVRGREPECESWASDTHDATTGEWPR